MVGCDMEKILVYIKNWRSRLLIPVVPSSSRYKESSLFSFQMGKEDHSGGFYRPSFKGMISILYIL